MANEYRISQGPVEGAVSPDDLKARVSQGAVEGAVAPTDQKARISQAAVEIISTNVLVAAFSQAAVEVVREFIPLTQPSFRVYIID